LPGRPTRTTAPRTAFSEIALIHDLVDPGETDRVEADRFRSGFGQAGASDAGHDDQDDDGDAKAIGRVFMAR
jgi:hypothetical protein